MNAESMTTAQKAQCLELAHQMEALKDIPGGNAFLIDMMLAWCIKAGLTVRDSDTWDSLVRLVQTLVDNDPDDNAADGVTVLDVWRKEARDVLAKAITP